MSGIGKIVCTHIFHGHVHLRRVDLNIIDIFHLAQKWQNMLLGSLPRVVVVVWGGGGIPYFKWQGWSNGGKNKTPQEIPSASNKTPQNPWTKIQPPKNPTPNFQAIKISRSGRNTGSITNLQIVLNTPKYPT